MTVDPVPFYILAAIAVVAAIAMVTSRNAVHAALFLVLNLGAIAVFYLTLNAPFLAMVQVAVYAGAIMVLFLFVIMLLGAERLGGETDLPWQRPLALLLALLVLAEGGYLLLDQLGRQATLGTALTDSSPQAVGRVLFEDYLFPFEVTSVLLLVAMVGAIVLSLERRGEPVEPKKE